MQLREKARKMGCDPVEVMINEIRDLLREAASLNGLPLDTDEQVAAAAVHRRALRTQAVEVAAKVAPYLHPRLATIELEVDGMIRHEHRHAHLHATLDQIADQLSNAELDVLEGVYQKLSSLQQDLPSK